jgi:GNAT superfamily N-acetyltransferase
MTVRLETRVGNDIAPYLMALAALRIEVFREYPYLYDGTLEYEQQYLRTYAASDHALFVLALLGEQVIGCATAVPLLAESEGITSGFARHGFEAAKVLYFGESVLRAEYRGQGLGHKFFDAREAHARNLGLTMCAFCAVDRSPDDARRPQAYRPLHAFWQARGYRQHESLHAVIDWREVGELEARAHRLSFWLRHTPQ